MASRRASSVQLRWIVVCLSGLMALLHCCYSHAQSVTLSWTPSTDVQVVGYNIYFGTVSGTYTNEISAGNVTSLTILDLGAGATYYFAAAAVDASGMQSPLSSEVAYFVDTNRPFLSITNITGATGGQPSNQQQAPQFFGQVQSVIYSIKNTIFAGSTGVGNNGATMDVSNGTFTVMGVVTDNVAVAEVYYSLNGSQYGLANTSGNSWYAQLTLVPGTNTIAAYAVDGAGNESATNTATLVYIVNSSLAANANFQDTLKPYLAITNLTSGMLWTNSTFTVMGVATDGETVASVNYSLNGAPYTAAATNGIHWNAALTNLAWGTNTFSAYAQAPNGNLSATDAVDLVYAVSNQLAVTANGLGNLSPNYSNAWLRIGENYNMTAVPQSGFVFTNWVVSTNFIEGMKTNSGASLEFMMASNLTLQANFAETVKPTLTISSPASGTRATNGLATVAGVAHDIWGVAGVSYQLNNEPWNRVATTNGYTNWTSVVQLAAGTNVFRACAVNLGGNYSPTNTVDIISTNAFRMQFGLVSQPQTTHGFGFNIDVLPGVSGRIEYSTNLIDWTVLTNFIGTNSIMTIYDPSATDSQRFYRAVVP